MADITVYNQGEVSDEGKVNWRGDQVAVAQGGQSIFMSSSVQLAELGERKVVGDRVFRYALAAGVVNPGCVTQVVQGGAAASVVNNTAGVAYPAGSKLFSLYQSGSSAANFYAEGYIYCQSGTAANLGQMYRIKSHASYADASQVLLTLYDPIKLTVNVTDKWSIHQNPYKALTVNTAGTASAIGVVPITVSSGDYFWLQTYGPAAVKAGFAAAPGTLVVAGATGQVSGVAATTATAVIAIGQAMQTLTVSEHGLVFLTIAP
jgi:hypothetical protein